MASKMTCPACNAHTSSVLDKFDEGEPCPHCGLSADAAREILNIRKTQAEDALKDRMVVLVKERDAAIQEARLLRYRLRQVQEAMEAEPPDRWEGE